MNYFEGVKKCLCDFENIAHGENAKKGFLDSKEQDIVDYFEFHLARALIEDRVIDDEKVAKFILTIKNLSNDIKIKIE